MDSQRAAAIGIEMLEKELLVNPPAGIPASAVASFFTRLRTQLTESLATLVNTLLGIEPNSQVLDRQYRGLWHLMTKETLRQELEQAKRYGKTRLDWLVTRLAVHRCDLLKVAESWLSAQHLKRTDLVPVPQPIPADDGGTLLVYELTATDIPAGIDTLSRDQFARFAELAYFNDDTAGNILLDIAAGWFGLPVIPPAEPDEKFDAKRLLRIEGSLRANDPRSKDREKVARAALSVRQRLLRAAGLPIPTAEAPEPQFVEQVIDPARAPTPAEILNALESIDGLSSARDRTEANLTAVASVDDPTLAPLGIEVGDAGDEDNTTAKPRLGYEAKGTFSELPPFELRLRCESCQVTTRKLPPKNVAARRRKMEELAPHVQEAILLGDRTRRYLDLIAAGDHAKLGRASALQPDLFEALTAWSENLGQPRSPWGARRIQAESANHPELVSSLAAFTEDGALVPQIANKPAWQPHYEGSADDTGQQAD